MTGTLTIYVTDQGASGHVFLGFTNSEFNGGAPQYKGFYPVGNPFIPGSGIVSDNEASLFTRPDVTVFTPNQTLILTDQQAEAVQSYLDAAPADYSLYVPNTCIEYANGALLAAGHGIDIGDLFTDEQLKAAGIVGYEIDKNYDDGSIWPGYVPGLDDSLGGRPDTLGGGNGDGDDGQNGDNGNGAGGGGPHGGFGGNGGSNPFPDLLHWCPIALDLDNDGLEYVSMANSKVWFDIDADHFAEHMEWLKGDDGFLVRDLNGNGKIDDVTEMFGENGGTTAYQKLAALDTNHDNKLDSGDTAWSTLRVWKDADEDGVVDAGELKTLAELNIASISTAGNGDTILGGHAVAGDSTYTLVGGATRTAAGVLLQTDQYDSWYIGDGTAQSLDIDSVALYLPMTRGYGTVPSLHYAMTQDEDLKDLVKDFASTDISTNVSTIYDQAEAIVLQWAGATDVNPTSRGAYIDARHLAVLEAVNGQPFYNIPGQFSDPVAAIADDLDRAYYKFASEIMIRLMVQGPMTTIFENAEYNFMTDKLDLNDSLSDILTRAQANAPSGADDKHIYWNEMARILGTYHDDLGLTQDQAKLAVDNAAGFLTYVPTVWGTTGNDYLNVDPSDVIFGNGGNDTINTYDGYNTYLFDGQAGNTVIHDDFYFDAVVLQNAAASQVALSHVGNDLVISISALSQTITFQNHFGSNNNALEEIHFSNGEIWDWTTINAVAAGGSHPSVHTGTSGADTITASATDLNLTGLAGADHYVFNSSSRSFVNITDFNRAEGDVIDAPTYISGHWYLSDLFIDDDAGHAEIYLPGGGPEISLATVSKGQVDSSFFAGETISGGSSGDLIQGSLAPDLYYGNDGNDTINGHDGNDTIWGWNGTDLLHGNAGNDFIGGDQDNDSLFGDDGNDSLYGGDANDSLDGGNDNDYLSGEAGVDTLVGSWGNDTLDGGAGNDTMYGGGGNDTFNVDSASDAVNENSNDGTDTVFSTVTYTLAANVENLTLAGASAINGTGNTLDNYITGNSANNSISGGDGNDTLDGGAGNDTMVGGLGNDTFYVDSASDSVSDTTSGGTDTVITSLSSYTLGTNIENLTMTGSGNNSGTGNTLANYIIGNSGNNNISGSSGADTLDGGAGADTLTGGSGDTTYIVDSLGDVVSDTSATGVNIVLSSVSFTLGTNIENLTLTGFDAINGTGNTLANFLTGNGADNVLNAGTGTIADTLDGGLGHDTMIGGAGNDIYYVDSIGDVVTENASEGTDVVNSSISYTLASNVETLILTGTDAINGTGNTLNNSITGNSGDNILDGGTGTDSMIGGAGNDTYITDGGDTITEAASSGTDTVLSSATYTLGSNVENLTLTGSSNINATGNTLDNVLTGNSGDNAIDGSTGNDTMIGGAGNDSYTVNAVGDVINENANEGIDSVTSSVAYTLSANVENLTLTAGLTGTGNSLNNVIVGNSSANTLTGLDGNDSLDGGTGSDTLIGGTGDDVYTVNVSTDVITENSNEGIDSVNSSATTYTLGANVENLTLTGTSGIDGTGNGLDNVIHGNNTGANILTGAGGNDTLYGGTGNDTLDGGSGDDVYVFDTALNATTNKDTITAFGKTGGDTDIIHLDNDIFTAAGSLGTLAAAAFWSGAGVTTAHDADDRIIYNTTTGALYYDADGSGGSAAIQVAIVGSSVHPTLANTDFVVID